MRKTISLLILAMLCICTACSSTTNTNQSNALHSGEYSAILPYESSDSRIKHASLISDTGARVRMEEGLMELSKKYFSPSEVAYKTQVFLTYDELDATDGSRGLLGTNRDDNPNGLNPSRDEGFDTGNGTVTGAVVLVDLYELDWYSDDELQGISIGMAVNDEITDEDGNSVEITQERMNNYLEVTAGHLVSYMRERFNEITSNVPIYIACFTLDSSEDSLGSYLYQGYFEGSQGEYSKLDLTWLNVPSTTFTEDQESVAEQFTEYQEAMSTILVDYSYVVGQARVQDDKVNELKITITCHGKSASELLAIVQAARDELSVFSSTECEYIVEVLSDEGTYALISRPVSSTESTVLVR